jgi:hypothetical protein
MSSPSSRQTAALIALLMSESVRNKLSRCHLTILQAPEVFLEGSNKPMRYCHQCGKFEPVEAFEGLRR